MEDEPATQVTRETVKLSAGAHAMCGWPLLLCIVGGAVGGGLGGAAYGINAAIYRSKLPIPLKIVLNIMTGIAAILLWLMIGVLVQSQLQGNRG